MFKALMKISASLSEILKTLLVEVSYLFTFGDHERRSDDIENCHSSSSKVLVAVEPEPSQISEAGVLPETTGTQAHPHTLEAQTSGISVVLYQPDPEQATEAANWQTPSTVVVNPKLRWYDGNMMELEMPSERVLYDTEAVSNFPGIKAFVPINGSTKATGDTEPVKVTKLYCHKRISKGIRESLESTDVSVKEFSKWEELKSDIEHI